MFLMYFSLNNSTVYQYMGLFKMKVDVFCLMNFGELNFSLIIYTWWAKSQVTEKKLNISITARAKELVFLSMIKACSSFISIRTCLEKPFAKYHYWSQHKNFTSSHIGRKTIYLTKGLFRHVFMDIKLEHASIINKKISSLAQAVMEIFNFFSVTWLLAHSVYNCKRESKRNKYKEWYK
jgi:hypothetical protein